MNIKEIERKVQEMSEAFDMVQMPRTPFVLQHFVVGQHDTEPQQYAQCVLELQIKYDVIRRALLHRQKIEIEIEQLESEDNAIANIDAALKRLDYESQERAMLGAMREFDTLYQIWQAFPHQYTRAELDGAQEEYWIKRLTRQAEQGLLATGRVGAGDQEALRLIGRAALPQLDHVREIEQQYLETGNTQILVAVPTQKKAEGGLPCVENLIIPSGIQVKYYNIYGRSTAEAYNDAAMTLLKDKADFMLTVEDDTFPPADALVRLLAHLKGTRKTIVGAWYPKRNEVQEGTPIVLVDGKRQALEADGQIHEVYTIPMGCTLFPAQVFLETVFPWFATTDCLSQDSFFSQKAREAGWALICDTSIRCKHVDRETGKVYEGFSWPDEGKIVLHVGCGIEGEGKLHESFRGDEWKEVRLDIDPNVCPDIAASLTDMDAINDHSVDAVWSSHNLEHLYAHEVSVALEEFYRVLKPGGLALIVLPDLQAVSEQVAEGNLEGVLYQSPAGPIAAHDILYGHRYSVAAGNVHMAHKTGFTAETLHTKLVEAGFDDVIVTRLNLALQARARKGGI